MLPALAAVAEAKAGPDGVRRVIAKRFPIYPQPERSDEEWADWFADYIDTLHDLSLASLEAGMRSYVADPASEFMPKPGKLREMAFLAPSQTWTRYHRANLAIRLADHPPFDGEAEEPRSRVKPEEVANILADFKARAIVTAASRPEPPSIAGKTDERGITPQMRELLDRQRQKA